jgi:hypothetical protein
MFWAAAALRKLGGGTKPYQPCGLILRPADRLILRQILRYAQEKDLGLSRRSFASLRMKRVAARSFPMGKLRVRMKHVIGLLALLLVTACLPDPQTTQMSHLLDQLVEARAALGEQPPRVDTACDTIGEVESRLSGEPGLVDVRPAWPALHAAAEALLAACGQSRLLQQPFEPTVAMVAARERWQAGVAQELGVACRYLGEAGQALGRGQACRP